MMTCNYKDGTETISLDAVRQAVGSDLSGDAPLKDLQECKSFFVFAGFLQDEGVKGFRFINDVKVLTTASKKLNHVFRDSSFRSHRGVAYKHMKKMG